MSLLLASYHGVHVPDLRPGHVKLRWLKPDWHRNTRVRERSKTCPCRAVVYTLFQTGGLAFIQRVNADDTVETERLRTAITREMWDWILTGRAV
ncbi:hypothetical protein [Microbispora sp. KK1-11]|uniref:hypothetical protein n=1 Tax=Microbispora sp. KK1-11 TaxID=2053005 RepID=UPI001159609A|nr:hypothetical protein [Microbispora sp. KK1-11]TQS29100.1 hypothetical protein FLW16_12200 [Microbispora sp. KK1-11]